MSAANEVNIFQHSKTKFVSPRGHVISSVYVRPQIMKSLEVGYWVDEEPYELSDAFPAAQVTNLFFKFQVY